MAQQDIYKYLVDNDEKSKKELETKILNGHARETGHVENFFAISQRVNLYKSFCVVTKFNKKVSSDKNLLFHAIRPLLLKYPILATTLVEQKIDDSVIPRPHDYIKVLNEIKYKDLFIDVNDTDLQHLNDADLYHALNDIVIPYGKGNLTWQLVVIDDYRLAYIANHILADAIAGKYFFQDLETQFSKLDPSLINSQNITNDSIIFDYEADKEHLGKLVDATDNIIDYTPPYWFFPELVMNQFVISKFGSNTPPKCGEPIHYKTIHITAQELAKMKKDLRDNERDKKITLTPYIQAAWLNAQYKTKIFNSSITNFALPVDTRIYFPGDDKDKYKYGLNTSLTNKFFFHVKEFTWGWVDYFNTYIKWCLKTKRSLYQPGLVTLEKIYKNKNFDVAVEKGQRARLRTNTLFSNMGLMESNDEIDQENGILIQDCTFSQHFNGIFYDFSINAAATQRNGLNLVISVPESAPFTMDQFQEVVDVFKQNLLGECVK